MMKKTQTWLVLIFMTLAAVLHFVVAPYFERLPANYSNRVSLDQENQNRPINSEDWQTKAMDVVRYDQTIINMGGIAIIEGSFSVYDKSGNVNFEISNRYGVDKVTRQNKSGYGNANRSGQYLFPPHTQKIDYTLWDPMYNGLSQLHFERLEQVEGLELYVFSFTIAGLDETDGYSYMPEVPELYLARTDGSGMVWVEPVSGVVSDYQDSGTSYLVNPATGNKLEAFNRWRNEYTPETRVNQSRLATTIKARSVLLKIILPGMFILAAFLLIFLIRFGSKKQKGKQ